MKYLYVLGLLFAISAQAESQNTCIVSVNREACPGKETEAYAPYKGVNPTVQTIPFSLESQCLEYAAKYAKIVRFRVIKRIEVSSSFNGTPLQMKAAEGPCSARIVGRRNK